MSFLKNRARILGAVFCTLLSATLFASLNVGEVQAQAFESDSEVLVVTEIVLNGNARIEGFKIRGELPFRVGDEITVPDDIVRGEIRLRDMGFFQEVAGDHRLTEDGTGVVVTYELFENPVISEIEISGNRNWNENKRLEILGLSLPWPFVNYIVTPERLFAILEKHGIKKGEVFNSVNFQKAVGVEATPQGPQCTARQANPSICREYQTVKQHPFFFVARAEGGEVVRIDLIEGVLEGVQISGVEGPFLEKAQEIVDQLPYLKPIYIPDLQNMFRSLVQSVYFEPLQEGDWGFDFGVGQDRLVMLLNLQPNILLEEPTLIEEITFEGNNFFSSAELSRKLEFEPGTIDNFTALQAIEGVHDFYQKEGFIMAQVSKGDLTGNTLSLNINEGLIEEIEIRQNGIPTARFTQDLTIEEIPLDEELAAEVIANAEETPTSVLGIEDESHPLVQMMGAFSEFLSETLGSSASSGLPYTQPEVIVKEMTLRPGEYLTQFEVAETYRALLGLEYFSDVVPDFQIIEETGNVRVIIDVEEQDRLGDFRFGGAVSQEGLVGQLSIRSKNLQGSGQDISVELDRGILGKAVINWSLGYQNRTILRQADYLSIDLFNRNSREQSPRAHLLNRLGGEAALAFPVSDIQAVLGFRHEFITKEYDLPESDDDESDDSETETQPEQTDVPEIERSISNVLSLTLNRDKRNNPIFATRGSRQSLSVERAGLLAGSEKFTKVRGAWIQHLPTIEDQTIAARFVGGWGDELPSQEQFVIGGSTTVRGIQPKFTDAMAFMNLEYRFLLDPNFSIALFVDAGTELVNQDIDLASLKKSIGIEARVTIPYAGPIRIAFAWPITDKIEYFKAEFGFGTFF